MLGRACGRVAGLKRCIGRFFDEASVALKSSQAADLLRRANRGFVAHLMDRLQSRPTWAKNLFLSVLVRLYFDLVRQGF